MPKAVGAVVLLGLLFLPACTGGPVRYTRVTPRAAEAVSLVGDTLWTFPLDATGGPARVTRINAARAMYANNPNSLATQLALTRALVALGRFREAVDVLSTAADGAPLVPRIYRLRGELLLWLREIPLAIKDLRRLPLTATPYAAQTEIVELPGEAATVTMLEYQRHLLLGFALYCTGKYPEAREVFREAIPLATTADEMSRLLLWMFFSMRRVGDGGDAVKVLAAVDSAWARGSEQADIQLLLAYKGLLPSDSIQTRAIARSDTDRALYSYAVGYFLALDPARHDEAVRWFEHARTARNWATMPYLAAEADLARLRRLGHR